MAGPAYFGELGLLLVSGGAGGVAAGLQQSLCCQCVVAAFIIAFGAVGFTGLLHNGQVNATPVIGLRRGDVPSLRLITLKSKLGTIR